MTLQQLLEHWAEHYIPLSHNPAPGSPDKSFFLVRLIDKESMFGRNANTTHSPSMLYSTLVNANTTDGGKMRFYHQIWFVARTIQPVEAMDVPNLTTPYAGRHDEQVMADTHQQLSDMAQDLAAYIRELRRTFIDPLIPRLEDGSIDPRADYRHDVQLRDALHGIDPDTIEFGSIPDLFLNGWCILGLDFWQVQTCQRKVEPAKYRPEGAPAPTTDTAAAAAATVPDASASDSKTTRRTRRKVTTATATNTAD